MRGSSFKSLLIVTAALGLAGPFTSRGAVVKIQDGLNGFAGTVDTHLRFASPTTSSANDQNLLADSSDGTPAGAVFPLLRFDNIVGGGANQIPANTVVNAATLILRSTTANAQTAGVVSFHRLLIPWNETDTWTGFFGDNGVQADDVEAMAVADGSFVPNFADPGGNPANTRERTLDVTAAVQAWVNGAANNGWVLINPATDGYRFDSSETTIDTNRPALLVDYGAAEPATIVTDPLSTPVAERGTVSFTVTATGSLPITYQWFKGATMLTDGTTCVNGNNRVVSGATTPTLSIANVQITDAGAYHCEVNNVVGTPDASANATLTVNADTTAPKILYARCGSNPREFIVVFSEPMNDGDCIPIPGISITDIGTWIVRDVGGANPQGLGVVNFTNQGSFAGVTVLGLVTFDAHTDGLPVEIEWTAAFSDTSAAQNTMDPGTIRALCFTNEVLALSTTWRYNDTGADLGPTWYTGDDATLPSSGPAPLTCRRAAAPPFCEAVHAFAGPVGTCTLYSNATTLTFITNHYFRTHFNYSPTPGAALLLETYIDDGAVIYVNGAERLRIGMPAGPVSNVTLANRTTNGEYENNFLPPGSFPFIVNGDNVIAVSLHQVNAGSSDLAWACRISELTSEPPIRLSISYDGIGQTATISWTGGGTLRSSTSVTAPKPWPAVAGAVSPHSFTPTGPQKFYYVEVP